MSYTGFIDPKYVKELDRIVNSISKLRLTLDKEQNSITKTSFIKDIDVKLLNVQRFINKEKDNQLK